MFEAYRDKYHIAQHLCRPQLFHPADDRTYWDQLRHDFGATVLEETAYFDFYTFEVLRASWYREFETKKDRGHYEDHYFHRRSALIFYTLAEAMYNDDRYMDHILDLLWMIMEETEWAIPAHIRNMPQNDSLPYHKDLTLDLFSAETATAFAFTYAVLRKKLDHISRNITRRMEEMIYDRILDNYLRHDEYWYLGMSGRVVNNWNPWINSNVLIAALTFAPNDRMCTDILAKVMVTLDNYLRHYPEDGACDEGPSYWFRAGASALECCELLRDATGGWINVLDHPKMVNTSRFIIKARIYEDRLLNFADCASRASLEPGTLMHLGKLMGDEQLLSLAKTSFDYKKPNVRRNYNTMRVLYLAENIGELRTMHGEANYVRETYLSSIHYLAVREREKDNGGLYLAAKGGHNRESHNHNDIGNFMVYKDGAPFLVDSGPMAYSALTFHEDTRYTLWTNISEYHNLPKVNGYNQHEGREFCAKDVDYRTNEETTYFSLDISDAYEADAGIETWVRTIELDKKKHWISVTEAYELNRAGSVVLNFLSAAEVKPEEHGLRFTADNGAELFMEIDLSRFDVNQDTVSLEDRIQKNSWTRLYRVRMTLKQPRMSDTITYKIY